MITPSENGISGDGSQYYGSAEYYSEKNDLGEVQAAHAPMQWVGSGAELLGLPTEIKTEHDLKVFDDLIKGKLPDGREMPQITDSGKDRRTGEDIVASAPKSVSIMATYGGDGRILEAQNRAVLKTVEKIQERMMAVRGMVDGKQEKVDGEFVIALAQHLDARPVDGFTAADLHTHMLFMNVAIRTSDGEIRAVTWDKDPGWQKEINATYISELAHELRQLGYELYRTEDAFEIVGISREAIETFSPRAKAIEKELEKMGLTRETATSKQKQDAAFKIREDKEHVTHEQMIAQGNKLATEKGYDFQSVREAALLNERHETHEQRMDFAAEALKSAARHFSERQSVFEAKEVIKYALQAGLPNGVTESEARQAWVERPDKHGLLTAKSPRDPKTGEVSKERWITTRAALARDEKMIQNLRAGKGAIAANERWTPAEIQREISAYEAQKGFKLSLDQVAAIHNTLGSGDRNTTWQGVAGAGKTTAVEVVKNAFENRGYKVLGIASGTQAVKELASIEVECKTYAMWAAGGMKADDKTIFIGDETGMTGSADGARAIHTIEQNKSRGLFIGDTRQLQAVDSGSPFRIMQKECTTSTLSEIRRQKTPEMLNVANLFSQGKAAAAAQEMGQFMHPVDIGDAANYKEIDQKIADVVAKEYLALPAGKPTENEQGVPSQMRDNTLLLVATNSMRERLNLGIREGLKAEGSLGKEEVQARTLHDSKATKEELRQAHFYDGKMKDEAGKSVQIVIMPSPEIKGEGYAIHGVKYADEATQKHYLEMRANAKENGLEKDAPVILAKGQEYRIKSVDLQKGEVRLTDSENREIIWKPSEAGKVQAFEEKQTAMAVNDKIIFKQNQTIQQPDGKEMKVFNGQKGVVQSASEDKIYIKTSQGEDVAINKDGGVRVEHAYSGTVHSMQGATQDYGIAALRAGSRINTANQGYVGQTRFRYEIKVHTDNVEQLQKDWGKGYQYQENAIDHANAKDLEKFNQQIEEKKMEIVEKEDSLDKAQAAPSKDVEPEKGPASVTDEREAPAGATREAEQREERAQPEPETAKETERAQPEAAQRDERARQPEAANAAPGKSEERETPDGAPRTEPEPAERQTAPQELAPAWDESVPMPTGEHEYTGTGPEPSPYDPEKAEKAAERATEAARDQGVIWDENVPSNTGEHEYLESSPESITARHHEPSDGVDRPRPQEKEKPYEPYISPEDKEKMREAIRNNPGPLAQYEAAQKALIGSRSHGHDPREAQRLQEKANDAWMRLHYPEQAKAQTAQAEPKAKPEKLEKGAAAGEKETPQREERAPREPEATRPPMDKLAQLIKMQEQRPERAEDSARETYNRSVEDAVRGKVDIIVSHGKQTPTHDKAPTAAPAKPQQPAQHKGHDKPMEREI
ncbi:relaxase domain-containing protein [Acidithiobacillus ferridurans]|nr:relaxase domain-containing protein [Acidithiobacillus ferridurans]